MEIELRARPIRCAVPIRACCTAGGESCTSASRPVTALTSPAPPPPPPPTTTVHHLPTCLAFFALLTPLRIPVSVHALGRAPSRLLVPARDRGQVRLAVQAWRNHERRVQALLRPVLLVSATYFESEGTKRKRAVDLSVAEAVDSVSTSKGHGFEISTPGRTWVFAAEAQDEMLSWMNTLNTMLGDIRERKKRQQMSDGVTCLKEGWADLKDETQDGEGAWEGHWFSLNSGGELKIFPDAESTEEQVTMVIDLKEIERVERSKGVDYYDFCIDLRYRKECSDKTTRMRPIDRGDMQAWLGVLQTQLRPSRLARTTGR